jgi:hypothetical protein
VAGKSQVQVTNVFALRKAVLNQIALRGILFLLFTACCCSPCLSQGKWRVASEKELAGLIPARAPVEKEQIETELRTASGVTDGKGKFIAGVVIITAGYAAEGKYSHFFIAQTPLRLGELALPAGEYVFGYKRLDGERLEVRFFEAATGKPLGMIEAHLQPARGPIRSLLINPPVAGKGTMQLGRFVFAYATSQP